MTTTIVGIDCATEDAKVGLALAEFDGQRVFLRDATICSRSMPVTRTIAGWLRGAPGPFLLAVDAPLGWPQGLGDALIEHQAGNVPERTPSDMFRRTTDRHIQQHLSKTPLDVGADRIARTAHAALRMISELRSELELPIPLAWRSPIVTSSAIEVYPAATLVAHRSRSAGYKKPACVNERREIIARLREHVDLGPHEVQLETSADVLDAVVCVLAGKDFLENHAMPPTDLKLAMKEGWIWAAPLGAEGR